MTSRREFITLGLRSTLAAGIAAQAGLFSSCKKTVKEPDRGTPKEAMRILYMRHATMIIEYKGKNILLDPLLAPVVLSVELPYQGIELEGLLNKVDFILLSHAHNDHIDNSHFDLIKNKPIFCQPADTAYLQSGFSDVRPVINNTKMGDITIYKTQGLHGATTGYPSSGYVLKADHADTVYISGDTIWFDGVEKALTEHQPDIAILNAGAANSLSDPWTMTSEHVGIVCNKAPNTKVIAVHMGLQDPFWKESRQDLKNYLQSHNLSSRVIIPAEGDILNL